jgi:hypothetical protein
MPINYDHKLIFIHIPKAGGTSIESFFGMTEPAHLAFYRWDLHHEDFLKKHGHLIDPPKMMFEPQHYTVDILKRFIPEYSNYFSFSFTRHPYTKFLSEYFWVNGKQLNTINEFNPEEFHSWCVQFLANIDSSHKEPQVSYIDSTVQFVGKYENFKDDFEFLKTKLTEFSPALSDILQKTLPHDNSTGINKNELLPYLLPESKQLISEIYAADFETFSYEK